MKNTKYKADDKKKVVMLFTLNKDNSTSTSTIKKKTGYTNHFINTTINNYLSKKRNSKY